MNETNNVSYAKLLSALYQLCIAEQTGTFFVTAPDGVTVAFILRKGVVTACIWEHEQGLTALRRIKELKTGHYVFSENVFFSLQQHDDLPSTAQIFKLLGHLLPENSPLLKSDSIKRYRGASVVCEQALQHEENKQPTIIYRGIKIDNQHAEMEELACSPVTCSSEKRYTYRGCHY